MIKKLFLAGCLLFCASVVMAKGADFTSAEKIQTVSVSNTTWTRIPGASQWVDKQRIAIIFDLDQSCTDYMLVVKSSATTGGPGVATTVGYKYMESNPPWIWATSHAVYIWAIIKGDGSENVYYQQLRGKF